jgi:hypothetical protein
MSKWYRIAMTVVSVGAVALSACRLARGKTPVIQVSPAQVQPGVAVRVLGQNWRAGERVIIGLNMLNARPEDSVAVATALTDAAGQFVALFSFPSDARWANAPELWVVAHTSGFDRVAQAGVSYVQPATVTPVSIARASATPSTGYPMYVLGYVQNMSASARIIKIKPIEGQADVIVLEDNTQIIRNRQPAQFQDVHLGDLVEATGRAGSGNSVIAEQVRILISVTAQPTAIMPTPTAAIPVWRGEYYNNTTFSGRPLLVRADPAIDFQWQEGAAAPGLPADNFAVRWTGTLAFDAGNCRFSVQVDDGVRLWLDEHLIIDQWHESTGALYSADAYLSANPHAVRVEYFNGRGSAHIKVWWEYRDPVVAQIYPDWKGEYFGNISLAGTPFLIVNDRLLDFDWADSAPASGMPSDNFSIRWTRTVNLSAGTYRFHARVDDGVRLWVDDVMLIDHWQDGAVNTYFGTLRLSGGNHSLRVEYYEHTGQAVLQVGWELLPDTPTPTCTMTPRPTPTLLPPTVTPTATPLPPTPTATPEQTPPSPGVVPSATLTPLQASSFGLYVPLVFKLANTDERPRRAVQMRLGGPSEGW